MILEEATFEKYGYYTSQWTDKSNKLAIYKCDGCGEAGELRVRALRHKLKLYGDIRCFKCLGKDKKYLKERQAKMEASFMKNLGVNNPSLKPELRRKAEKTTAERYGCVGVSALPEFKKKTQITSMERFGVTHASKLEETQAKKRATNRKKYGVDHVAQTDWCKAKVKATNMGRYGVKAPLQSPVIFQKVKDTNVKKYGHENTFQVQEFKDKSAEANLRKYGFRNAAMSQAVKDKATSTSLERWGTEYPMQNAEVREKTEATNFIKYGNACALLNEEVKAKSKQTCRDRYGAENPFQSPACMAKARSTCMEKYGVEHAIQNESVLQKGIATKIEKYGTAFPATSGRAERLVRDWLNSFGYNFESNYKILGRKEIDMYDASLRLGIEYCGLHWHNENSPAPRDKNYHNNKRLGCNAKGIRLITIFEDEWLEREFQVKSFLKSVLKKNSINLYARKCSVRTIAKKEGSEFVEAYHIQGKTSASKHFAGLFFERELVGVMSFGPHPRSKAVVLDRLCFKDNVNVVGGASKLFKFLLKETGITEIISWSDNRWSEGAVYKALGFELEEELRPDYSYTNTAGGVIRLSKQSQKKSSTGCPEGMTEKKWANQRGLSRVWDCGKKRWKYTKPDNRQ